MDMSRSFDRSSRNPANSKKPRLITEESPSPSPTPTPAMIRNNNNNSNSNGNGRGIVQRQSVAYQNDDSGGSEGYQPQSLLQIKQQQHQELVSQYRTALAELTFNSKPIITNLTIIAGENTQAAKAIAATICNNIIEVPSDQKLPSLYLLDSIVKNIGRDYIKHFSTRLPEVFCKAYRQVDSSLHSGMRHLFGTWKGVFPPQSLQSIEKELGFQLAGNGSSSGLATARTETQPQQPARSIHVNPKFMGAGQKLQLSNRVKSAANDITANRVSSPEDTGRQNIRAANINPPRARADPRLKLHQAQRDADSDLTHENSGASYNNFDFGPDISSERVAEQGLEKSWYGSGNNITETISRLTKHGLPTYSISRPPISDVKLTTVNKGGGEVSRSWKNSEEEEYMWDDVNSVTVNPTLSKRDPRLYFDPERPPQRMHDLRSEPSSEHKEQLAFRQQTDSVRSKVSSSTDEDGRLDGVRKLLDNSGAFSTSFSGLADGKAARSRAQINPQIPKAGNSRKSQLPIKQTSFLPPYQPESVSANPSVSPSLARPKSLVEDIPKPSSSSSLLASVSSIFANKPTSSTSNSSVANAASNPVSSLLSTLVAKGLISAAKDDNRSSGHNDGTLVTKGVISALKDDHHSSGQSDDTLPSRAVSPVVVSSAKDDHHSSTSRELSSSKPVAKSPVAIPQSVKEDIKCGIGLVFKPDVIRVFHPNVISDLIDDLPHQCNICGLRFKLQERFDKHMEWHTSKINTTSRKWFSNSENWVNGCPEEALEINGEMMVNADEGQFVCVLCGEMFDDFYSQERNKWMFKGAAYLDTMTGKVGNSKNGVIVHVNCISEHSLSDLELANGVKIEKGV